MALPTGRSDREYKKFVEDVDGNPAISVVVKEAATNVETISTAALAESIVAKAAAGTFYSAYGFIDETAATSIYYIQVHNAAAEPSDSTVVETDMPTPIIVDHTQNTPTAWQINLSSTPVTCDIGIVLVCSTDQFSKTETSDISSFTVNFL